MTISNNNSNGGYVIQEQGDLGLGLEHIGDIPHVNESYENIDSETKKENK